MRVKILPLFLFLLMAFGHLFAMDNQLTLLFAGDIFPGEALFESGYVATNQPLNFSKSYELVEKWFKKADITAAWFGGPIGKPGEALTAYPLYRNPPEFMTYPYQAGINIFLHTNHLLDRGLEAMFRTIRFAKSIGSIYLGAYETENDSQEIYIIEKNKLRIALLSYLFGSNQDGAVAHPVWSFNTMDPKKIKRDIQKAKILKADFIIVAMHWGTEYQSYPNTIQTNYARMIAASGADLIVGSHPHYLQTAEMLTTTDDQGKSKKTFVLYSMGNFLSIHRGRYLDNSIMARFTIRKNPGQSRAEIVSSGYVPIWVQYHPKTEKRKPLVRIYPVLEGIQAFKAKTDKSIWEDDVYLMRRSLTDITNLLAPTEKFFPLITNTLTETNS